MSRGHTVCATDGCPELAGPGRNRCPAHDPGPWAGSTRSARLPANWRTTLRPFVLERDGYRCTVLVDGVRCPEPATEVDHVTRGDDHRPENLRAICAPHHRAKTQAEATAARAKARRRAT